MNLKKRNSLKIEITNTLINKNIENILEEFKNAKNNNNITHTPKTKLNESIDNLYQRGKGKKYFEIKFLKIFHLIQKLIMNKNIVKTRKINNSEKEILKNKSITSISIIILKDYINKEKHKLAQNYIQMLLFFISNDILKIDNFIFIIDVLLKSIVNKKNSQLYQYNNEVLLFINDIIETIINYDFDLRNNTNFIEKLINMFNNIYVTAKNQNIFIKKDIFLKLYENKEITNESYSESEEIPLDKLNNFLVNLYKNHIPKNFYNEIFRKSAIDFPYYLNTLQLNKMLFKAENELKDNKVFNITNGIYFYGFQLVYENLNFTANDFSLIFSFKINEYKNEEEIILFNITHFGNNSIIRIIINNDKNLIIAFNKKSILTTNIIIEQEISYWLCITYNHSNEQVTLYINTEKTSKKDTIGQNIFINKSCYKYTFKKKLQKPNFKDNMIIQLGKKDFYGILGEILLINIKLEENSVEHLVNSKDYYGNLIYVKKFNNNLINKKVKITKNCKNAINHFKALNYTCLLRINPYLFYSNNKEMEIFEYKIIHSIYDFINEKGIEFLTFMLHNINSQIKENNLFNLYIYKTIDFLYNTIKIYQEIKNKLLEDEYDSYYEINEEELFKQLDIFFLTFLSILKNNNNNSTNKDNYSKVLSGEIRNILINCLSLNIEGCKLTKNIILSILFDSELFEQKKYINDLNELFSKQYDISMFNEEIIYKIFLFDFIFESKNIKHKKYCNLIASFFSSNNNSFFFTHLIRYINMLNNDIKIYHYLKIIYYNIDLFKIEGEDFFIFFSFIEKKFETLKKEHCKYCSYIIILCFLIKPKLWNDKENSFFYSPFGYMTSPSFLFIRCVFIRNFNLTNEDKLKFIKTKSKNLYNLDFFDSIKKNPIELFDTKTFKIKFNELMNYINFLFNLEKNKDLDIILENFFPFILEFLEKIRNKKYANENQTTIINNFIKDLFSSQELSNFFILYLKYNHQKAMKKIIEYINSSINNNINPFYFYLLLPEVEIGNTKNTENIKLELIKNIILVMIKMKKKYANILYFLILIYKNIYEKHMQISKDFPKIFLSYYMFISDHELFLDKRPLDLNFFNNKKKNFIDDNKENEINNVKFISEIIIDIMFRFFFEENDNNIIMIKSFLIKENACSVFYNNDENIKNYKKNDLNEKKNLPIFKAEIKNILFCLYFLIIFFNKLKKYKNYEEEKLNTIKNITNVLFNDLNKIYKNNHKITSIFKKIENYGPNFEIYNKMLDICNKNFKDSKFSLEFLYDKYLYCINSLKNKAFDIYTEIRIQGIDDINYDNNISDKKNKIERSKSFDIVISNHLKKKYLENPHNERTYTFINLEDDNNILNQSMLSNLPLDLNDKNNFSKKLSSKIMNLEENDFEGENYIKNQLSKINIIDFYYDKINNNCSTHFIKVLFNPKSYFLWNNFTMIFKDLIFNNKKFKKLSRVFDIHTRKMKIIYSSEKDKDFSLNYPTKIKNYIIDDYYRPFLKPYLKFFNHKYITKSHEYMKKNILNNPQFKEDKFYLTQFQRIIPNINNEEEQRVKCEIVKNRGCIFGLMIFKKDYIMFINSSQDDERNSEDLNKRLEYIYSIKEESLIDENKYIIMFYKDIKEIIRRRICFNYVGYEIFMKDNHSYLFNFFNYDNIKVVNTFLQNNKINNQENIKLNKNTINEKRKKNDKSIINCAINNISPNNNNINFTIIDDPKSSFEKMKFKSKYKKGEITNFNYLLLLNKFSSRSFNDYNQYLIFPLLFLDVSREKKRDLSKPICLNKENNCEILFKIKNNKETEGFHFNQHYSTGGFILFYLLRLIPFTYCLIEFQSGKFDLPARLFNSMENFLYYFNITQDNRELCPEFYFNYEFLLNLNHNDFGVMEIHNEVYHLNNFDSNNNETFAQFIINFRNSLEKTDISPWIDNIFGIKQFNTSNEEPNSFPLYSYEQFNEFEKIKKGNKTIMEKINTIRDKIEILRFGITPAKIFNKIHPKPAKHINDFEEEKNSPDKKEQIIEKKINNYIENKSKEKEIFYLINNNNTNANEIELILKFNTKIDIFKIKIKELTESEESFIIKDQIDMEPYNNLFCKILPGIICIVRNKDKTIKFISNKDIMIVYQWTCIVTAIEPFIKKKTIDSNQKQKKVFIGDEKGYLHIMVIEYEINQNKSYEIKTVKIKQSIKAQNSLIKGITYNERLNIIISWSDEGVISINNDYSLSFLNIIDLGNNIEIKEILISKYDLLIINCYNNKNELYKILCFTLNGIQVTCWENGKKINRCLLDEKIGIILENGNMFSHDCFDLYSLNNNTYAEYIANYEETNISKINIKYCNYYPTLERLLLIYSDNTIHLQKLPPNFL